MRPLLCFCVARLIYAQEHFSIAVRKQAVKVELQRLVWEGLVERKVLLCEPV